MVQLKRANVAARDIIQFYTTCLFDRSLNMLQMCSIIPCQRILVTILNEFKSVHSQLHSHAGFKYEDSLVMSRLSTLRERRNKSCENFFNKILANPSHKLFNLISISKKIPFYNLRNERTVDVSKFKTERFKNSFLIASSLIVND